MLNEQYMDGVAAITQCKAAPHQTQVYEFKVTNKGTHYWHGRKCNDMSCGTILCSRLFLIVQIYLFLDVGLERSDGFQGTIIINDPYDPDEAELKASYQAEEVIFLQDWYHRDGLMRRTG